MKVINRIVNEFMERNKALEDIVKDLNINTIFMDLEQKNNLNI